MPDTIGAKMKIEGESQFSKAMRDAAKNTKALDAELKLAQAQFEASGDAAKLMADRGKILKEELREQEKAVEAAKTMLAQLAKAGYETNSQKVLEWRGKLAQAEQSVLQLNNSIKNNENGLDSAGRKYEELGQSMQGIASDANTAKGSLENVNSLTGNLESNLQNIGSGIGWQGLSNGVAVVNDAIDKAVKKVGELSKKIWEAGVDATVWADNLATNSDVYGISTETLQRWQYASRFVDTSVETIVKAREKLNQNMGSSSKETALAFNELHVATRDVSGKLREDNDVFWDVIAALGAEENATKRDILAQKTLGKSYAELAPLVKAGREEWEKYADAAPILSEQKVQNLANANNAIEDMDSKLQTLKLDVLEALSPTIEAVAVAIGDAATKVREFVDSEQGQAAISALSEAVTSLITDFTEQDFGSVLQTAADNVTSFVKSLADLLKDKDKVINALGGIALAIGTLRLAEAAANAGRLLASLRLISAVKATGTAGTVAAGAAGSTGKNLLATILGSTGAKVLGGVGAGFYTFFSPLIDQFKNAGSREAAAKEVASADKAVEEHAEELGQTLDKAEKTIAGMMIDWGVDAETAKSMYLSGQYDDAPSAAQAVAQVDTAKAEEVIRLTEAQAEAAQKYWDIVRTGVTPDQEAAAYQDLFDAFADSDESVATLDALMAEIDALPTNLEDLPDNMYTVGGNIVSGVANGIHDNASVAIAEAEALAQEIETAFAETLDIHSPSRVMEQIGEYIGQGLANGMGNTDSLIQSASARMMGGITLQAPAPSATPYAQSAGGGNVPALLLAALSSMRVEIDGRQAGNIMLPTIEELMAEQTGSRRYE